jgi:prephenate dehydrogenase
VIQRLAIVGLGLLGGSVAKAARAEGLARSIVAVGRSAARLEAARRDGSVDRVTTDLAAGLREADFVLLAAPVAAIEGLLPDVWRAAEPDATVTDVGSAKAAIVRAAERLAAARSLAFVGGHPMAGSEQSGYAVARADLFQGATVILTPTERTDLPAAKRVTEFWEAVGARVTALDPERHDQVVAAISHLPHLAAYALVESVARLDGQALDVAARGFKDTTRIATSDPRVWREIFLTNRAALGQALAAFRAALAEVEALIEAGEGERLERKLAEIKGVRERLS